MVRLHLGSWRVMRFHNCELLLCLAEFLHVTTPHLCHLFNFTDMVMDWKPSVEVKLLASLHYGISMLDINRFLHQSWLQICLIVRISLLVLVAIIFNTLSNLHFCSLAWNNLFDWAQLATTDLRLSISHVIYKGLVRILCGPLQRIIMVW